MLEHSAEIGQIAAALAKAQGKFSKIVKDTENPFFKMKYAPLSSVIESIRKAMSEEKIAVLQDVDVVETRCVVTTMLTHESGQWMKGTINLPITKQDPQGVGSASTYGRRYGLSAFVNVAADDDDDGNAATHGDQPPKKEPKRSQLTDKEVDALAGGMQKAETVDQLKEAFTIAVKAATKVGDTEALQGFTAVKEQQKAKLEAHA